MNDQGDFLYPMRVLLFITFLSLVYQLSCPERPRQEVLPQVEKLAQTDDAYATAQQRKWAEKQLRRFAESQERGWRNWTEAMFEEK